MDCRKCMYFAKKGDKDWCYIYNKEIKEAKKICKNESRRGL